MSVLYFTEQEVDDLLDMPLVIETMEQAFRALAKGEAHNVPRVRAKGAGIVLHSMCAAADYLGLVGWKQYTTTRHGAKFHVGLYEQDTGELIALVEANRFGQLRTGAVTGLAAKLLANDGAEQVGLIGTGWQAESQLAAVAAALPIKRAFCYSRDESKRNDFAARMQAELEIEVTAVQSAREAVNERPVVITATTSRQPVIESDWISPGTFIAAVGSNWLEKAEIDVATIQRSDMVVCDSIECCQNEAGDFTDALEEGAFRWDQAVDLAQVVAGNVALDPSGDGLVLFKSVGMAIEDVALGAELLRLAKSSNAGRKIDLS